MDYSENLNALKESLAGYSAEEEKLSQLYKNAVSNAEKEYGDAVAKLNQQYYHDRNEAYADTARSERNALNAIAARGLGFSGEAAQAKLNSNIALSNRLGTLTRDKNNSATQLSNDLSKAKNELAMDEAKKIADIQNNRNSLNADITSILLNKENNDNKLAAEKEMQAQKIAAEKEMQSEKLAAEKEMQAAELKAKYQSIISNSDSENNNTSNGNTIHNTANGSTGGYDGGYIPTIAAKELAKQLISSATDGRIETKNQNYLVNKYILELEDTYGIDKEYLNELIFMLEAYGYDNINSSERRILVVTHDADAYYEDMYDKLYDQSIKAGQDEAYARKYASTTSAQKQLEYIYDNSNNVVEFSSICSELGISTVAIKDFLNKIAAEKAGGSGHSANNHATIITR